jgi:hypothetical protein
MARFILTKHPEAGAGGAQAAVSTPEQIRQLQHIHVLDQADECVMLVEVDPAVLARHRSRIRGWTVAPEVVYGIPRDNDPPSVV